MLKVNLLWLERMLLIAATFALLYFLSGQGRLASAGNKAQAFELQRELIVKTDLDTSLWSEKRLRLFRESTSEASAAPIASLSISRIGIEAPVYEGTSEQVLDSGIGRVEGTAKFSEKGNVGIAAHRDGIFRGLKDIQTGDEIRVATLKQDLLYKVVGTEIVSPTDVHVLDPTETSRITLITCYPFYFVGSAPQRFIVYADIVERKPFSKIVPK